MLTPIRAALLASVVRCFRNGPGSGKTKTLTGAVARAMLEDVIEPAELPAR
jgi:hypothetical protein